MSSTQQLDQRARELQAEGADPRRIELVERARRFKRSWIEMAEALTTLRKRRTYERWGYKDLHTYCAEELLLNSRTVDKLTGSYQAIKEHVPDMLKPERYQGNVPPLDCVDYFARATGHAPQRGRRAREREQEQEPEQARPQPPEALVSELHQAVFDEGQPLSAIRRRFDEALFPKSDAELTLQALRRAGAAAGRLRTLLPEIAGLDPLRQKRLLVELEALAEELSQLLGEARAAEDAA